MQSLLEAQHERQVAELKVEKFKKELHVQRQRLGRDLHDGFGSQLTHLNSRLELLAYRRVPNSDQLLRLSEFTREMNHTLRETIWLLDQEQITAEALGGRMHGLLLKVWEDRKLPSLKWQFMAIEDTLEVHPLIANHLLRIAQEGTNNALKYAGALEVSVIFKVSHTEASLTITDNGKGLDAFSSKNGSGLTNMRKRAEEVQGAFTLDSSNSGTCIKVLLPIRA